MKILLKDLQLNAEIGIHDFEKGSKQPLLIDVTLEIDDLSIENDEIDETIDYDFLRTNILELVSKQRFNLQETLAKKILLICKENKLVERASVYVRKTTVYPDVGSIGVLMEG